MNYTRLFPGFSPGRLRPPGEGGLAGGDVIGTLRVAKLGHDLVGQVVELVGGLQDVAHVARRAAHLKARLDLIPVAANRRLDEVDVADALLGGAELVTLGLGRVAGGHVVNKRLSKNRSSAVKNGPSHVVHVFSFIEWLLITLELYVLGFKVFAQ